MALTPRMEVRQSQGLVMTPQLMQSIKLLQLSNAELQKFVDAELEQNPLIEREETIDSAEKRDQPDNMHKIASQPESELSDDSAHEVSEWMENKLEASAEAISDKLDSSLENIFPDDNEKQESSFSKTSHPLENRQIPGAPDYAASGGSQYDLEAFVANEITLRDHLVGQLSLSGRNQQQMLIARHLLDHVDESGYMRGDTQKIAVHLGVEQVLVEEALELLQSFEPVGICARSLEECLKIQLKEKDRLDPAMLALVNNLGLLARRDFAELGNICQVDREDLVEMMQEIQALDPKPGTLFEHGPMQSVVPDVIVESANDGGWKVELNTETLPRILVNQSYYAKVVKVASSEREVEFLNDCLQTANWLHRSLDQRAQTILKVSSEIVRMQDDFLLYGVQYLRPLNLRTIAEAIGMHESTVSRVTSNKYMQTNRGVFELKYFFTSAIQATGGDDSHSAEAVRDKIRKMIDEESPKKVLSDDKIVNGLQEQGVDIARRTVAKYREAMKIPSSVQRRREKKALAGLK